ncbi:Druantia anti-phage system protein DruA [Desulfosoma caldarium]|uniref:Uncharacterized protein DUF4338 n=1 Tax=Desulfosoma caldarium TaxID=610254 RepID=A0A3N1UW96_9BACT|nr:Druantia anti-phage system protein DruA [Desulfosoma caldarium]ROQ92191.1 uncharacterized protein DUF4338 [Desulfosoma caldarium]
MAVVSIPAIWPKSVRSSSIIGIRAGRFSAFGALTIEIVRRRPDKGLWDFPIDRHLDLIPPWIVGSYHKNLAYLDDSLAASLGWGYAAWKVAARDQVIGWTHEQRERCFFDRSRGIS